VPWKFRLAANDVLSAARNDDLFISRIQSRSREVNTSDFLDWNFKARGHVAGIVDAPGANRSFGATTHDHPSRRMNFDQTATPTEEGLGTRDHGFGFGVSAGGTIKNQQRPATADDQEVSDGVNGHVGETLALRRGKLKLCIGPAENAFGGHVSVSQPVNTRTTPFPGPPLVATPI